MGRWFKTILEIIFLVGLVIGFVYVYNHFFEILNIHV